MNLINDTERSIYEQAFKDLHDTWGRDIVVWKTPTETIVSTDPNYNGFYGGQDNQERIELTPQSGVFKARIKYLTNQEILESIGSLEGKDSQQINVELGAVRIRVSGDALEMLQDAERITFDEEEHTVFRGKRPHGLFKNDFYDFILQKIP